MKPLATVLLSCFFIAFFGFGIARAEQPWLEHGSWGNHGTHDSGHSLGGDAHGGFSSRSGGLHSANPGYGSTSPAPPTTEGRMTDAELEKNQYNIDHNIVDTSVRSDLQPGCCEVPEDLNPGPEDGGLGENPDTDGGWTGGSNN